MSFLLRNAVANGLSLHALRDLAGAAALRTIWAADAGGFAALLGVPLHTLEPLLVRKGRHMGDPAYVLHGQVFLRKKLLRLTKPQICTLCVHRFGYCRAMWDCRLYTVCHLHKMPLTDRCKSCGQALNWFRPAVDVCRCGMYFAPKDEQYVSETCAEFAVATRISRYFAADGDRISGDAGGVLPSWIDDLSLDGLCTLIQAMGAMTKPHQVVVNGSLAKGDHTFWRAVCSRAWRHLEGCSVSVNSAELMPWVWEAGLQSLSSSAVSATDQRVAQRLLHAIFTTARVGKPWYRSTPRGQMHLFEE